MVHTILLIQKSASKTTRSYDDFESVGDCCEALIKLFENHLKAKFPNKVNISYDISELNQYLDGFQDVAALVFQPTTNTYSPRDRDWVKDQIYKHLKRAVGQR